MMSACLMAKLCRLAMAAGLALVSATGPAAAGAEVVVVSSSAPGLTLGQRLPAGQAVELPMGANAVFLLASGRMIAIPGPFTGPVQTPEAKGDDLLSRAALAMGRDLASLGGARVVGPEAPGAPQDLLIWTDRSDDLCVRPGDRLFLDRPSWAEPVSLTIEDVGRGAVHRLEWPAGLARIAWPDGVKVGDGVRVRLRFDGEPNAAEIRFRQLDNDLYGPAWIAALMHAGCTRQGLERLVVLRDQAVPLGLYLATDRGSEPVYRVGDPITFRIRTDRDAFLYCFVEQADGSVVPIFPSTVAGGAHIQGQTVISIPGDRLPIQLRATDVRQKDRLRCFAADQDISGELPAEFVGRGFAPMSPEGSASLDRVFHSLRRTRLAEAEVTIRVK
jgi:hypothetical protein